MASVQLGVLDWRLNMSNNWAHQEVGCSYDVDLQAYSAARAHGRPELGTDVRRQLRCWYRNENR